MGLTCRKLQEDCSLDVGQGTAHVTKGFQATLVQQKTFENQGVAVNGAYIFYFLGRKPAKCVCNFKQKWKKGLKRIDSPLLNLKPLEAALPRKKVPSGETM